MDLSKKGFYYVSCIFPCGHFHCHFRSGRFVVFFPGLDQFVANPPFSGPQFIFCPVLPCPVPTRLTCVAVTWATLWAGWHPGDGRAGGGTALQLALWLLLSPGSIPGGPLPASSPRWGWLHLPPGPWVSPLPSLIPLPCPHLVGGLRPGGLVSATVWNCPMGIEKEGIFRLLA